MLAAQINKYGNPDVIEINDIKKPSVSPGQVLVKVYAASVNPFDAKLMAGYMQKMIPLQFPLTMGGDFAGVVTEVGKNVENFNVGNKVYGSANKLSGGSGAFAEFACVPAGALAKMPANINFNEAAAAVLAGVSAVQAIFDHFQLKPGQKILIHGGAGGIGTMAIQIAKSIGAYVVTTATGDGIGYVKKLGADQVVDYKNENFDGLILGYDAVFDMVGGETFEKSFKLLKSGGIIVSMAAQDQKNMASEYGVTVITQYTKVTTESLNMLTDFIRNKNVKIHIDKIFSFDRIKDAFYAKANEDIKGKIVVEIIK